MSGIQGILGIVVILLIAWGFSENKGEVRWKTVALTLAAQIVLALILLKVPFIYEVLQALTTVFAGIQSATMEGTRFVFGFLGSDANVFPEDFPFVLKDGSYVPMFAFVILPQILVFSILVAVFWHWGILPRVIKGIAWVMQRSLHIGGAVGLAAAASLFVGMVESPLVIRAYLKSLSRSEFFMVITCGMATVAGSIMGLYAAILGDVLGDAIGHIITASMINIFGAILIARIMIPGDKITGVDGQYGRCDHDGYDVRGSISCQRGCNVDCAHCIGGVGESVPWLERHVDTRVVWVDRCGWIRAINACDDSRLGVRPFGMGNGS
ncbi:MAG: hypothetical protein J4G19_02445 [Pseudomonadales bacterium]|nr:hypothetical protein [Pseudomonadales bacterium]